MTPTNNTEQLHTMQQEAIMLSHKPTSLANTHSQQYRQTYLLQSVAQERLCQAKHASQFECIVSNR